MEFLLQSGDLWPNVPGENKKKKKENSQNQCHHYVSLFLANKWKHKLNQSYHWLSHPWKKLFSFSFLPGSFFHCFKWKVICRKVFEAQLLGWAFCCGKGLSSNSHHPSSSEVFLSSPALLGSLCSSSLCTFIWPWISLWTEASFLAEMSEISECPCFCAGWNPKPLMFFTAN